MKKIIAIAIVAIIAMTTLVSAKDMILDTKIHRIYEKQDKNGNPFKLLIIKEKRTLNGVAYEASTTLTSFQDTLDQIENLNAGDNLKAIVSSNQYNGRVTYTLIQIIE